MKICNCHTDLDEFLCDIPKEWRTPIVNAVCLIMQDNTVECEDIVNCETLTNLSPFTLNGTILSIKYKNENGYINTRSIDLSPVIESSLDDIDPSCLMTQEEWDSLSNIDRWNAIFSAQCDCCSTTTTTTTSTSTTTTTTSAFNYYIAMRYSCMDGECQSEIPDTVAIALPFIATVGYYYPDASLNGDFYRILGNGVANISAVVIDPNGIPDCDDFCTTTTTTTTSSTTTTTSTSTTTTTTEVNINFSVVNEEGDLGDINNVSAVFIPTAGSFPLDDTGDQIDGIHPGFSSALSVQITNSSGDCHLVLYKNGVSQECIDVTGNGIYTFAAVNFLPEDICKIYHFLFLCAGGTTTTTTTSTSTTTTTTETPETTTTTTTSTSTTTTTTFGDNMIITNNSSIGSIDDIEPAFFAFNIDGYPVDIGEQKTGIHGGYSGGFNVTVTAVGSGSLRLYKNAILQECVDVSGSGIYPFSTISFTSTDIIELTMENVLC